MPRGATQDLKKLLVSELRIVATTVITFSFLVVFTVEGHAHLHTQ